MLNRPELIAAHFATTVAGLQVEKFWVLCLNRENRLLKQIEITSGTATAALAHPREVFRAAIRESAAAIACVHNHPSGDPAPSAPDTSCGSGGFLLHALDKVRRQADDFHADDPVKHYKHWHDFAEKQLYGIEINEQIARTAKMNMIIHDDGHTNVVAADGLLPPAALVAKTGNPRFVENGFDIILTNPPFGSTVRQAECS